MPVENLDDVRRFLTRTRERLLQRVEALPAPVRTWRPAPEKWAPAEHLEHLALTEQILVPRLRQLADEAEAAGWLAGPDRPRQVDALPVLFAAGAVGTAKEALPESRPNGRPLAEVTEMLQQSRAGLMAVAERLALLDTDRMEAYIPVANVRLNGAQVLHFVGLHERLHLQHIDRTVEAWENRARG